MEKRKLNKKLLIVALMSLLTLCCVLFIFGNSLKDSTESSEQSFAVKQMIVDTLEFFGFGKNVDINVSKLRNLAHVAEFFLLGGCLSSTAMYISYKKGKLGFKRGFALAILSVGVGCFIAVCDELLQKFSDGRACDIYDVGLDSIGVLLGVVLVCAVFFVVSLIRRSKESVSNERKINAVEGPNADAETVALDGSDDHVELERTAERPE